MILNHFICLQLVLVTHDCHFIGDGMKPNQANVQGIVNMPPPADVQQLLEFLMGIITFVLAFMLHMSYLTAPLRNC